MSEIYRIHRPDGTVEFTDVPQGPGQVDAVRPGQAQQDNAQREQDHADAKNLIKEAQKRIPKLIDYLEYLSYLRNHSPYRLDQALKELQCKDPQAWLKLQQYPQFRPLFNTALGLKAADKHLAAGIGMAGGAYSGSAEKWLETTIRDLMKRDRWGPYADVLGAKATTLPAPKAPTYSNSRLGQYMKQEDARLAAAGKASAKELELSRAAVRSGLGTAVTRGLGPLVEFGMAALDPQVATGVTDIALRLRLERAALNHPEFELVGTKYALGRDLLAQGRLAELKSLLERHGQ